MFTVSSFGLTERELKEAILPNIDKIQMITTVNNVPVLEPLECTFKEVDKLLWNKCRIRIVSQGNLSKFIQGVLHDEETRKEAMSFCVLLKLDTPQSVKCGIIPCLLKRYELLFVDVKRHQILGTKDAIQYIIPEFSLTDYRREQIVLPTSYDSSHLAQSFIGAQVFELGTQNLPKSR